MIEATEQNYQLIRYLYPIPILSKRDKFLIQRNPKARLTLPFKGTDDLFEKVIEIDQVQQSTRRSEVVNG